MAILAAIKGFLGDGFAGKAMDFVNKRWPPNMSEEQKAQMEVVVRDLAHKQEMELLQVAMQQDQEFNDRIAELEGTASDLKSVPILGPIVLFARGLQRPLWGFATLYLDFRWFFGTGDWSERQEMTLFVINMIVLGFLFGERAVKNLEPVIARIFNAK